MLTKSNVYKVEWLDLVFANRNKEYRAYELRYNYNKRLLQSLFYATALFSLLIASPLIYDKLKGKTNTDDVSKLDDGKIVIVDLSKKLVIPQQPSPSSPAASNGQAASNVRSLRSLPMVVVPQENVTTDPPTNVEIEHSVVSQTDHPGESATPGQNAASAGLVNGNGNGTNPQGGGEGLEANSTAVWETVEKLPVYPGGEKEFYKYLSRTLQYPENAKEGGIVGRVVLSFVVEKNGSLSNITVVKGIGGGCDEEAVRVLRRSKAWEPGIQNGQKVRVQYTVPIVFNLSE